MSQPRFTITFKKSAYKELEALPKRVRQKILDALQLLAINPYTELLQIKKLKGAEGLFRFRIQDYRVIYLIEDQILRVTVIKVGHRGEVYR